VLLLLRLLLAVLLLLPSCTALNRARRFGAQQERVRQWARIEGRVDTEGPSEGTLVVVLARPGETGAGPLVGVDTFVRLRPGRYAFPVAPGRYLVGAYEDRNRNGRSTPGSGRSPGTAHARARGRERAAATSFARRHRAADAEPVDLLGLVERTPRSRPATACGPGPPRASSAAISATRPSGPQRRRAGSGRSWTS
jgi:hypothetical protein